MYIKPNNKHKQKNLIIKNNLKYPDILFVILLLN